MDKNIFISSTYLDLIEYREAVSRMIRQLGAIDISMENFGARDERPREECLRLIEEESTIFVGIYAYRYGYIPRNSQRSILEDEYEKASTAGLKRLIYIVDEQVPWPPKYIDKAAAEKKLMKLKLRLKENHICSSFTNKDDLAGKVVADLGRHFSLWDLQNANASTSLAQSRKNLETAQALNEERKGIKENNRHVYLVHTIEPSEVKGQQYNCYIYLKRQQSADLSDIDYATFFLGPKWGSKIFKVKNNGGLIGITASAYGPFLCTCCVKFTDGHEVRMNRFIDFEMGRLYQR